MRRLAWLALALFVFAGTPPAMAEEGRTSPDEAVKFVAKLSGEALDLLRSKGLPLAEKEKRVRTMLADNFDLALIGRYVLGPSWRTASDEQRDQYLSLFQEFVLRTYSRRLGGYTGQTFEIAGASALSEGDVLVTTRISRPSGPPIEAGWRVRGGPGGHKILDVVVSGVSMVVTQRSEFRAVIRREGLDGLIEILRAQVSKFSAKAT